MSGTTTAELKPGYNVTQEQLDGFFTSVRENHIVLMCVKLGDLSLKSLGVIEMAGIGAVKASEDACNSLMNIVGVNSLLRKNMSGTGFGPDEYIALANTLRTTNKERKIGVLINTNEARILRFTNNTKAVIPADMFVERLQEMVGKRDMRVIHASIDGEGSISMIARPNEPVQIEGLPNEDYRSGIEATYSVGGAGINAFYERMVCLNGAIGRVKLAGSFGCRKPEDAAKFLRAVSDFQGFDQEMFKRRVKLYNETQASLYEVKQAAKILEDAFVVGPKKGDKAWDIISTEIPLEYISSEITKRTGIKKPISSLADPVLRQMRSPMTSWELFNAMTQVSTHIERRTDSKYSEKERRYVSAKAGSMLFEHTPDLYMPVSQIW